MSDPDYSLGLWGELKRSVSDTWRLLHPKPGQKRGSNGCLLSFLLILLFLFLFGWGLGPINSIKQAPESASVQKAHSLGLALFEYAQDNNTEYPKGKSSTEVFQKLMDGGYVSDPTIFYIPMSGKVPPTPGQKTLKPENVSWDVTSDADTKSPDTLPLVFMTGYKVLYLPAGSALPLVKPYPRFGWLDSKQAWFDWLVGRPTVHWSDSGGIAVYYNGHRAVWINLESASNNVGLIPNFVPPDFKPDGMPYRQLTPDGVLP